jgi:hypothetical protein
MDYDHRRLIHIGRTTHKYKKIIEERWLKNMNDNVLDDFWFVGEDFKFDENVDPIDWRITTVPIIKYDRWHRNYFEDYYVSWNYYNDIWVINFLYNLSYIVKHCQNDLPLFEIIIININNARFLPQIKAFLQDIEVDDIPIKPSPPIKFNKCLLKCKISHVHETDDIISGDGIKNHTRAVRPYKILFNLHDCIYQMNCYSFMNDRLHSPLSEKQKENYMNICFYCQWKENEPLFDSSKTKDYEITIPFPDSTEKEEEEAYYYLKEQSYLLTRHESLSIFESIKIKAWLFLKVRSLLETLNENSLQFNLIISKCKAKPPPDPPPGCSLSIIRKTFPLLKI